MPKTAKAILQLPPSTTAAIEKLGQEVKHLLNEALMLRELPRELARELARRLVM